jgi:hypothetical protein
VASTLGGQGCYKALVELLVELLQSFVRSFVQSFCRALVELDAELLQSFYRALVELNVLKFVTCILQVDTARVFFLTNEKLAF